MQITMRLQGTCVPLRLRPGDEVACLAGQLWLTMEAERSARASCDIVLAAGDRHVVAQPATCYLTCLHSARVTTCRVDLPPQRQGSVRRLLRTLARALPGARRRSRPGRPAVAFELLLESIRPPAEHRLAGSPRPG